MKVLVTSGTGFIGSFVVEELLNNGHEVVIIANGRQLPAYLEHIAPNITYVQADFGEGDSLNKALKGCNAVIHLAWSTVPRQTKGSTAFEFSSNIISSINLFEKCLDFGIKKIVFISSGGTVYGVPNQIPIPETHDLRPISNYGLSKLTAERLIFLYNYSHGIDYCILRVSNAYGERQNLYKNQGVIGVWLKSIIQDGRVEVWGDGSVVRDYVYVKDVALAVVAAVEKLSGSEVLNVGGGQGYSLNSIINEIRRVVDRPFEVAYRPSRNFDVPVNILDITKVKGILKYEPLTTLSAGITKTWRWMSEQCK